ncbi:hypothetical protein [Thiolapillus sp.]|uniref:hypothetical protein n=1 Tax=Thiolapillus sp. TaxID=2017437 RepID=UPI0025E316FD|nr:hypothetical protein [Thiolapillus sp.]
MTRTAGAQIGCQRPSRFWGLGCPKIYHEAEDTLALWYPAFLASQYVVTSMAARRSGIRFVLNVLAVEAS